MREGELTEGNDYVVIIMDESSEVPMRQTKDSEEIRNEGENHHQQTEVTLMPPRTQERTTIISSRLSLLCSR